MGSSSKKNLVYFSAFVSYFGREISCEIIREIERESLEIDVRE